MAVVTNAFTMLHGEPGGVSAVADDAWSTVGGGKKKRKGKAKDVQRTAEELISQASSRNGLQAPPSLADSAASIADSAEQQQKSLHVHEAAADDGFRPAGRKGAQRNTSRAVRSASTDADAGSALLSQSEAAELLKQAAQSVSGDDRLRLWQEWQQQVAKAKKGKGVSYIDDCGRTISFEQVLRSSGAVELSVQGSLAESSSDAAAAALQSLLSNLASPPLDPSRSVAVANAVAHWRGLLGSSSEPPAGLLASAQQAISAVLASLLDVPAVAGASVHTDGDQQGKDAQAALAAAQAAADATSAPKDAAAARRRLLSLAERQLAGGSAGQEASAAAASAAAGTAALVAFTEQRVRALQLMTSGQHSGHTQRSAALSAFKSEDAGLAAQAAELEARAAALQAQLAAVRRQQEALAAQRAGLRAQYAPVLDPPTNGKGSSKAGAKAAAEADAALADRQLAAARELEGLLDGAGGSEAARLPPAAADMSDAAAQYLSALQASLEADVTYLKELEGRAQSAAERLQRVRRQGQELTQLGLTDKEAANRKLQATLQRTLTETAAAADPVASAAAAAAAALPKHAAALEAMPPAESSASVDAVKASAAAAAASHAVITAAAHGDAQKQPQRRRTAAEVAALLEDAAGGPLATTVERSSSAPVLPPAAAINGDALSVLSARLAAMDVGSSQPQRPPRPGRRDRPAGTSKLANGNHTQASAPTAAAGALPPAENEPTKQAAAPQAAAADRGISPADKVTVEPAKRVPSSGSTGGGSAAEAAARAALTGLGAWGRPLGS